MAEILIATPFPTGHAGPMLTIAQDLVARGNRVTVMTGAVNAGAVSAVGAELHPLPPRAVLDDARLVPSRNAATTRPPVLYYTPTPLLLSGARPRA
jgi:UDP:flavonoid glycosyltransferase YjiC (YdhE family)